MSLKKFVRNRKRRFVVRKTTSKHYTAKRCNLYMCRCRFCEARVTLERDPAAYRRRYACRSCGTSSEYRDEILRVDWYRTRRAESRARGVCECDAAPFPHRPNYGLFDRDGQRHACRRGSIATIQHSRVAA